MSSAKSTAATDKAKQKEDVLLMVKHVRYKKVDGTLYVNSGRVAWRNQTSDSFKISAPFEDIRVQRISPEQKEKVQLQLLMHNGESFTFHFSDPAGRQRQLELRNSVKEMLQSLLPKFKDKAHSELREKFRLLESNPQILALYKELVVTGILSSEEFWARPEFSSGAILDSQSANQDQSDTRPVQTSQPSVTSTHSVASGQISRGFQLQDRPQSVGVPNYLLSDIKPEADGTNGIKYSLTHDTIDAIFRAYPMVRQRHRELVPDKLSETEFWIKFFQSHYFHRDRVQLPKEDVFADCANLDERYLQNEIRRSRRNRMSAHLDLTGLTDHDVGTGYGLDSDTSVPDADTGSTKSSKLSPNQLLLRRFNNHSFLVLKSLGTGDIAGGLAVSSGDPSSTQPSQASTSTAPLPIKDQVYTPELVDDVPRKPIRLDLTSVTDYLEGPIVSEKAVPSRSTTSQPTAKQLTMNLPNERLELALNNCKRSVQNAYATGRKRRAPLLSPLAAQMALADVSPGGCLLGGIKSQDCSKSSRIDRCTDPNSSRDSSNPSEDMNRGLALLTAEQLQELSLLYASACELLRHFWACFPVTSQQLSEKLERISASLVRFRSTKVAHFAASLNQVGNSSPSSTARNSITSSRSRVTDHLECMLDAAQRRYTEWKAL